MADYRLHCVWAAGSDAACAALVERLEALEWRSREEKLALHYSRSSLASEQGDEPTEETCAELRAIVADHPDYAAALASFALFCHGDGKEAIALLQKALDIEPDNVNALRSVLTFVHGFFGGGHRDLGIDPSTLAEYREALYEAAKARSAWGASVRSMNTGSRLVWQDLFGAARFIYAEAVRVGDQRAAEALQDRVRRDVGLDALDYGGEGRCTNAWTDCLRGSRGDSLAMAC